jgi:hypothetical protein
VLTIQICFAAAVLKNRCITKPPSVLDLMMTAPFDVRSWREIKNRRNPLWLTTNYSLYLKEFQRAISELFLKEIL